MDEGSGCMQPSSRIKPVRVQGYWRRPLCCIVRSPDSSFVDRALWCLTAVPCLMRLSETAWPYYREGITARQQEMTKWLWMRVVGVCSLAAGSSQLEPVVFEEDPSAVNIWTWPQANSMTYVRTNVSWFWGDSGGFVAELLQSADKTQNLQKFSPLKETSYTVFVHENWLWKCCDCCFILMFGVELHGWLRSWQIHMI